MKGQTSYSMGVPILMIQNGDLFREATPWNTEIRSYKFIIIFFVFSTSSFLNAKCENQKNMSHRVILEITLIFLFCWDLCKIFYSLFATNVYGKSRSPVEAYVLFPDFDFRKILIKQSFKINEQ